MTFDPHRNLAASTVAVAPSPAESGTSMDLDSLTSALFPDPATYGAYNVVVYPAGVAQTATNTEIVRVTAKSGDTLTITREQESTSARAIIVGDIIEMPITAKSLTDIEAVAVAPQAIGSFAAYRTGSAQSVNASSWTKVQLNAEEWDVSGWFDKTTNYRFTPQQAGLYYFDLSVQFADAVGDQKTIIVALYKNGAAVRYFEDTVSGATANEATGGSCMEVANGTTDYFEMYVWHDSGAGARNTAQNGTVVFMHGHFVGTT